MSEPFDARMLRGLVREAASEEGPSPDWDRLEDALFARLDDAPTALSLSVDRVLSMGESSERGQNAESDDEGDDANTSVRLSELPGEDRPSSEHPAVPDVAVVASHRTGVVHMPGVSASLSRRAIGTDFEHAAFADLDEADRKSSAAIDSFHSPSLMLEPKAQPAARSRGRAVLAALGALAVAAGVALFVGRAAKHGGDDVSANTPAIQQERWVDPSELPLAQGLDNVRDAAALRRGDVVEATQGAVAFGLKDRVMWTLAPGSRVRIESAATEIDGNQIVELQSGSIRASVAGDPRPNPLVVQAGEAMVSVEGGALPALITVTRSSKGLAVEVEKGSTLVGALSGGVPHRLDSLQRATLSLDARDFKQLEPITVNEPVRTSVTADGEIATEKRVDPPQVVAPKRPEPVDTTPTDRDLGPSGGLGGTAASVSAAPATPVLTEASIRASLTGCIESVMSKQASSGTVSVSAESTVRFVIDEDGLIRSAGFNPPLKPELQACAVPLLRAKVNGASRSIQFPISVHH